MGRAARVWRHRRSQPPMESPNPKPNDLSRSPVALDHDSTLIAVIEMSQSSWLVAAIVPGLKRQPLAGVSDESRPGKTQPDSDRGSDQAARRS